MKKDPNNEKQKSICSEIQPLLFEYMNRELGGGRSDLVREHLRKCASCQEEAAAIQSALDFLRSDSKRQGNVPNRLSAKHRARIARSVIHPVIDWISTHHILISMLVAAVVFLAWALFLVGVRLRQPDLIESTHYTITIARPSDDEPVRQKVPQNLERLPIEPDIDTGDEQE